MLSDFPALDLSDDACSVVYLFFLNSCQGFSSAFNACHICLIQDITVLAATALTSLVPSEFLLCGLFV